MESKILIRDIQVGDVFVCNGFYRHPVAQVSRDTVWLQDSTGYNCPWQQHTVDGALRKNWTFEHRYPIGMRYPDGI